MSTIAVKKVKLGDNADTSKNFLIEVPAVADGTLTIKRENGTAVLSIAADGKAVIPGVVGTVAQVGGVPTGQVVERGSNANGEYIRFADGTQICFREINVTLSFTAIGSTGLFSSAEINGNNAAAFMPGVRYTHSANAGSGFIWTAVGASGQDVSTFRLRAIATSDNSGQARTYYIVAIGRWF